MLSFLRDQNFDDLPAEKAGSKGANSQPGSKASDDQDFVAVATSTSKVRKSTAVLVVLLVGALACVWFMVKRTSPQSAGAAAVDSNETEIATAISRITGVRSEIFNKMDEIVEKFNEFSEVPQVEVRELVKNPFELETLLASLKKEGDDGEKVVSIDYDAVRRQQMQKDADALTLQTIMQSDDESCCMIDGKFLHAGDSVGEFVITQIKGDCVTLEWTSKADAVHQAAGAAKLSTVLKLVEE
ncbi:MAG: hypothetical protein JW720_03265 [Sedimentisphaerales bacterium]|nr:hypothetical protein [Sedimentisphaerales bacterium]